MRVGEVVVGPEAVAMTVAAAIKALVLSTALVIVSVLIAFFGLLVLGISSATPSGAAGRGWPGPHAVEVLQVQDADTIVVRMRDGPCGRGPCPGAEISVRVRGVDAPEVHLCRTSTSQSCAQCDAELVAGRQAAAAAKKLLTGAAVRIRDIGPDPYWGRYVATIELLSGGAWQSYADILISRDLAVPYDPAGAGTYRKPKPWCARDQPDKAPAGSAQRTEVR
jgi:endonuclease YncB( thermonuclease family)